MKIIVFLLALLMYTRIFSSIENSDPDGVTVTIAILAKDKAHCLPLYLQCIERQTWPASRTHLWIRTNNNTDRTKELLREWIDRVSHRYKSIYFNDVDVAENVQDYGHHEWNALRLSVLGKMRNESLRWAIAHKSHYFTADCDNFIQPSTLESLIDADVPIIAPLLRKSDNSLWANFFAGVNSWGYMQDDFRYVPLLSTVKGIVEVPLVHCTYLIQYPYLDRLTYTDETKRYEFIIFSDSARKNNIPQYIDTRQLYGRNSEAVTAEQLSKEPWLHEFSMEPG